MHNFEIEEAIFHTAKWPDHRYKRVYRVSHKGGASVALGEFEDESQIGIVHTPIVLDDRLVVFSSAHVFIWRPGEEPIQFNPFAAEGWYEYSQEHGLNGHYDYLAESAWIEDGQWTIRCKCVWCDTEKPEELLFYSDDGVMFDLGLE